MKPLLHAGRGDLVSFEIKGSRGADNAMVRLIGSVACRRKEDSDVGSASCRIYSVGCVQSNGIPTNQVGERNFINITDTIGILYFGTKNKKLPSNGIDFRRILCTVSIISIA
jgi:hypothetical protein